MWHVIINIHYIFRSVKPMQNIIYSTNRENLCKKGPGCLLPSCCSSSSSRLKCCCPHNEQRKAFLPALVNTGHLATSSRWVLLLSASRKSFHHDFILLSYCWVFFQEGSFSHVSSSIAWSWACSDSNEWIHTGVGVLTGTVSLLQ